MTTLPRFRTDPKLLLSGIRVELDAGKKAWIESKARRLLRKEPDLLRVRIDVERDVWGRQQVFTAKGRMELAGPDLTASVSADTPAASVILLIDKLDRLLRKRTTHLLRRRVADDIRAHGARVAA